MPQKTFAYSLRTMLVMLKYALALLVWVYIIYRALVVEISHDEIISYNLIKRHYWNAIAGTYNTHWLNSIFIKCILWLPGADSFWKLRLLSILSWPVFAHMIIKLSGRFNNRFVGWLFYTGCILNPFLVLYFSLARGYAPAFALLTISLWYAGLLTDRQQIKPRQWLLVFIPAALAVLANFSVLYLFLSLTVLYAGYIIAAGKWKLLIEKNGRVLTAVMAITVVFSIASLLFIKFYTKEIETSGGKSFIEGMFVSQFTMAGYQLPSPFLFIAAWCWLVLVLVAMAWSAYGVFTFKKLSLLFLVSWTCGLIFLLNILFHVFLTSVYLSERRVLFSFCFLVFTVAELLDQPWFSHGYKKIIVNGVVVLLGAGIIMNAYSNISLHRFNEWRAQPKTREALDYLVEAGAKNVGLDSWQHLVTKKYYTMAFPGKYPFKIGASFELPKNNMASFDYLLFSTAPTDSSGNWKIVFRMPEDGVTVLKYTGR